MREINLCQLDTVSLAGTTLDFLAPLGDLILIRRALYLLKNPFPLLSSGCISSSFEPGVGSCRCCDAICNTQTWVPPREHSSLRMVHRYVKHVDDEHVSKTLSAGGFTSSWLAMNYPGIKGLILDATFDHLEPLAIPRWCITFGMPLTNIFSSPECLPQCHPWCPALSTNSSTSTWLSRWIP